MASISRIIFVSSAWDSRSLVALSARSLSSFSFVRVASVIFASNRVSREVTLESIFVKEFGFIVVNERFERGELCLLFFNHPFRGV